MREAQADRRLFSALNKQHWGGRLPLYRVLRYDSKPENRGGVDGEYLGFVNYEARVIWIKRALAGDDLRETMLHEMAHVAVEHCLDEHGCAPGWAPLDSNHGPRWQAEIRRILAARQVLKEDEP